MRGKYSPTVSGWYSDDQKWWRNNCVKAEHYQEFDKDGYDSYGYDKNNIDRAGVHENDYALNEELFENVWSEWWSKPMPKINY